MAAPASPAEVEAVARVVHKGVLGDPRLARAWAEFAVGVARRHGRAAHTAPVHTVLHRPALTC
ncbi:hypothetical protein ACRJ4W_26385 [Streptomyces sp. GLT-R25]